MYRKIPGLLSLLLALSLLLVACGESSPALTLERTEVTPQAAIINQSTTASSTATAIAQPPSTPTAATAESTATLAPLPTATTLPSPTPVLAPTATFAPLPTAAPPTPTPAPPPELLPRFEADKCVFTLDRTQVEGRNINCGYLIVAEQHGQPNSKTIRLPVAILKASGTSQEPPLIYLQGGPGGQADSVIAAFGDGTPQRNLPVRALLANRDIVFFDQRGAGGAQPLLSCRELNDVADQSWQNILTTEEENRLNAEALIQCRDRLTGEGNNLAAYNSAENAADVNDLRMALGYDKVDLYGISYGTRLALTVVRDFPQGVRSVILDSTYPPQIDGFVDPSVSFDRALNLVFKACDADPTCFRAFPDIKATFSKVVSQLNTSPAIVQVRKPRSRQTYDVPVNGKQFVNMLFNTLYSPSYIQIMPLLISQVQRGNYEVLRVMLPYYVGRSGENSQGMYYSVQCNDEGPFSNLNALRKAAGTLLPEIRDNFAVPQELVYDVCPKWPLRKAAPIENLPVRSSIPTLILAGEYDPITPPAYGQLAARTLSNSYFVQFSAESHGVVFNNACAVKITQDFLRTPTRQPDTTCAGVANLKFLTSLRDLP